MKQQHLTLEERNTIELRLKERVTFKRNMRRIVLNRDKAYNLLKRKL